MTTGFLSTTEKKTEWAFKRPNGQLRESKETTTIVQAKDEGLKSF